MDWARAKNIFILLFFLLNIFLSAILINTLGNDNITKDTIYDAQQALAQRGVAITCDIPDFNGGVGTLTYDDASLNREKILKNIFGDERNNGGLSGELDIKDGNKELKFPDDYSLVFTDSDPEGTALGLNNVEGILNYASNVLKGTEVPVFDYHLDMVEEKGDRKTYIFKQKYKDFWIHENYIAVGLTKEGVEYLELRYRKVDSIINSKKVMPVHQVLIGDYESIKNITITKIDLGFKEHKMDDGSRELDDIPVWRVEYGDDNKRQNKFFKAYDGTEIE